MRGRANKRGGAVVAVIAIAAIGGYALWGRPDSASSATHPGMSSLSSAAAGPVLFAQSAASSYELHWKGSSSVPFPGSHETVDVDVELEGLLLVRPMAERADEVDVVFSIPSIRTYDVRMKGKAMFDDATAPMERAALTQASVLVTMDKRGPIRGLAFDPKTPKGVRNVLERVVEASRITLPVASGQDAWDAEESTPTGLSQVHYSTESSTQVNTPASASGAKVGRTFHRERLAYTRFTALPTAEEDREELPQHVDGKATITLDERGGLLGIEDTESVSLDDPDRPFRATQSFHLARTTQEPLDPKSVDVSTLTDKGNGRDPRKSDEAVVGSMTGDAIGTMIVDYGHGVDLRRGFMVRATAYARLHPDTSKDVQALFFAEGANNRSRTLVVDLLSATGDATAQESLASVLTSKEALADEAAFGQWVQRAMLVQKPSTALCLTVQGLYEQGKKDGRRGVANASAVPLGALARKLVMRAEGDLGAKLHQMLTDDLAAAKTDDDRIALLKGLGNAAFQSDDAVIAPFARSTNAHVREQAAWSLRLIDTKPAHQTLLLLTTDKNRNIAETALRSLRRQSLMPDEWNQLAQAVISGKTNPGADSTVVTLLRNAESEPGDSMRLMLVAVQARNPNNTDLRDEIQLMLDQEAKP
jgi:hypothetical protein